MRRSSTYILVFLGRTWQEQKPVQNWREWVERKWEGGALGLAGEATEEPVCTVVGVCAVGPPEVVCKLSHQLAQMWGRRKSGR